MGALHFDYAGDMVVRFWIVDYAGVATAHQNEIGITVAIGQQILELGPLVIGERGR